MDSINIHNTEVAVLFGYRFYGSLYRHPCPINPCTNGDVCINDEGCISQVNSYANIKQVPLNHWTIDDKEYTLFEATITNTNTSPFIKCFLETDLDKRLKDSRSIYGMLNPISSILMLPPDVTSVAPGGTYNFTYVIKGNTPPTLKLRDPWYRESYADKSDFCSSIPMVLIFEGIFSALNPTIVPYAPFDILNSNSLVFENLNATHKFVDIQFKLPIGGYYLSLYVNDDIGISEQRNFTYFNCERLPSDSQILFHGDLGIRQDVLYQSMFFTVVTASTGKTLTKNIPPSTYTITCPPKGFFACKIIQPSYSSRQIYRVEMEPLIPLLDAFGSDATPTNRGFTIRDNINGKTQSFVVGSFISSQTLGTPSSISETSYSMYPSGSSVSITKSDFINYHTLLNGFQSSVLFFVNQIITYDPVHPFSFRPLAGNSISTTYLVPLGVINNIYGTLNTSLYEHRNANGNKLIRNNQLVIADVGIVVTPPSYTYSNPSSSVLNSYNFTDPGIVGNVVDVTNGPVKIEFKIDVFQYDNIITCTFPYCYSNGNSKRYKHSFSFISSKFTQNDYILSPYFDSERAPNNMIIQVNVNHIRNDVKEPVLDSFNYIQVNLTHYIISVHARDDLSGIYKIYIYPWSFVLDSRDLVKGTINDGYFERLVTFKHSQEPQFKTRLQIIDYAANMLDLANFQDPIEYKYFEINYLNDYLMKEPISVLNITEWTIIGNEFNVTKTAKSGRLEFNLKKRSPLPMNPILRILYPAGAPNKEFVGKWDEAKQLYIINFDLLPNIYTGNVDYELEIATVVISSRDIYAAMGDVGNIKVYSSDADQLPPLVTSIARVTPAVQPVKLGDSLVLIWNITIQDSLNGFEWGEIKINSEMDQEPYTFEITPNYLVSGDKYLGVYQLRINQTYPCITQTFKINQITLRDTLGYTSKRDRSNPDFYIDPLILLATEQQAPSTITIQCDALSPRDTIGPKILTFTFSPDTIDVGLPNDQDRTIDYKLYVKDDESVMSTRHIPIVYATYGRTQLIMGETYDYLFSGDKKIANYYGRVVIPYGLSVGQNIFFSVYGLTDAVINFNGFSSRDLASLNFKNNITITHSFHPRIQYTTSITSDGGLLSIYGNNFNLPSQILQVDYQDGNGYNSNITNLNSFSVLMSTTEIKPTKKPFKIRILASKNIYSNEYLVTPKIISDEPTPSPSSTPSLTPTNSPSNTPSSTPSNTPSTTPSSTPSSTPSDTPSSTPCDNPSTSPSPTPQSPTPFTKKCLGEPLCGGPLQGECDESIGCICIPPWSGFSCQSKVINNTKPSVNDTTPESKTDFDGTLPNGQNIKFSSLISLVALKELDFQNNPIKTYNFTYWNLTKENSQYMKLKVNNIHLFGKFINIGLLDDKVQSIENVALDEGGKTLSSSESQTLIGLNIKYFKNTAVLDPDFSWLLDTQNDNDVDSLCSTSKKGMSPTKMAGIVVGSIAGGAAIVAFDGSPNAKEDKDNLNCEEKMVVALEVDSNTNSSESLSFTISEVQKDGQTKELQYPIDVSIVKSEVYLQTTLEYVANVAFEAIEHVINKTDYFFGDTCNDVPKPDKATCGMLVLNNNPVKHSQGFCCTCDMSDYINQLPNARSTNDCKIFGRGSSSAHCLRFGNLFYYIYKPIETMIRYDIIVKVKKFDESSQTFMYEEIPISHQKPLGKSELPGVDLLARLVGDFAPVIQYKNFDNDYIAVVDDKSNPNHAIVKLPLSESTMTIPVHHFDLTGSTCNKIGVSYSGFQNQPNRCGNEYGSCLKNQLKNLFEDGSYVLSNHVKTRAHFESNENKFLLMIRYEHRQVSMVTLTIKADSLKYKVNVSPGRIVMAEVESFEAMSGKGILSSIIQNTGTLNSEYHVSVVNCSDSIAAIPSKTRTISPGDYQTFEFNVHTSTVNGQQLSCFIDLQNVLAELIDSVEVLFNTSATKIKVPQQNSTGSEEVLYGSDTTCDTFCPNWINIFCYFKYFGKCWSSMLAPLGFYVGIVLVIVVLYKFKILKYFFKLLCGKSKGLKPPPPKEYYHQNQRQIKQSLPIDDYNY
eukprot:gene3651-4548_t